MKTIQSMTDKLARFVYSVVCGFGGAERVRAEENIYLTGNDVWNRSYLG